MPGKPFDLTAIFEDGYHDAESGRSSASNPYFADDDECRGDAWIDGFREFIDGITDQYRQKILVEGRRAASLSHPVITCPYTSDKTTTRCDIWIEGYRRFTASVLNNG